MISFTTQYCRSGGCGHHLLFTYDGSGDVHLDILKHDVGHAVLDAHVGCEQAAGVEAGAALLAVEPAAEQAGVSRGRKKRSDQSFNMATGKHICSALTTLR